MMPPSMRLSTKLDAAPTSLPSLSPGASSSAGSSYGAGPDDCERFDGAPGRPPPRDGWRVCSRGAATKPRRAAASSEVGSSSSSSPSSIAVATTAVATGSGSMMPSITPKSYRSASRASRTQSAPNVSPVDGARVPSSSSDASGGARSSSRTVARR